MLFKHCSLPEYWCWPSPSLYDHSALIFWGLVPREKYTTSQNSNNLRLVSWTWMNVLWVMLVPGAVQPFIFDTLSSISATVMVIRACSEMLLWSTLRSISHWALLLCGASISHMLFQYFCLQSWWGCSHTVPLTLRVEKDIYNFLPAPTVFIIHWGWIHIFDGTHFAKSNKEKYASNHMLATLPEFCVSSWSWTWDLSPVANVLATTQGSQLGEEMIKKWLY